MKTIVLAGLILTGLSLAIGGGVVSASRGNDGFKQADRIHSRPFSVSGVDTVNATTESGEPQFTCVPVSQTVWYRLDLKSSDTFVMNTAGSTYDTVISVFASDSKKPDFSNLRLVGCNDDFGALTSRLTVSLDPGTYFVQVADYGSPSSLSPHLLDFDVSR